MMEIFTELSKSFYHGLTGNLKTQIVYVFSFFSIYIALHLVTLNFLHQFVRSFCKPLQLLSLLTTTSNIFVISKLFHITFPRNISFDEHHKS